jgi:hypothetical protein
MHQLGKLVLEAKSDEYINNMDREMQGLKHRYNNSKDNDERKKLARDMYELNRKLGDVSVKNDANKIKSNEIIGNRDTSIIQAKQKDAELEQKRAELAARIKQQEDMNKNSENQNTEMKRKNDVEIKKLQADIAWGEKEKGYKIRDYRDKNKKSGLEQKKLKGEIADRKDDIAQSRTSQSAEADVFDYKHTFSKPDDLEHPTGVRFFTQISLEPTYIDIPIKIGRMENKETFIVRVETLAKSFTNRDSSSWSTMIILSSFDLEDNDHLVSLISNYRKLTKYVIGDIIITNETKESAYFCTPRMNHCQEIPFDYLKKVLNLKDVLDYSEASRASAWKKETSAKDTKLSAAVTESVNYKAVTDKVNDILKGF